MKLVKLLKGNVNYSRKVACIAYSREASKEIKNRVENLLNKKVTNVFINTVHSFCLSQIIIPYAHLFKYNFPRKFRVISEKEKATIFKDISTELGHLDVSIEQMDAERTLMLVGTSNIEVKGYEPAIKVAVEYEIELIKRDLIDFITIIKTATILVQNEPYVRKCLEAQFPWILIDEYQDLGKPLHEMVITLITSTKIKIIAVGDPDQSIFGFSGAIPKYFLELEDYPNFDTIHLKKNYRSHQQILDASVSVLGYPPSKYLAVKKFDYQPEINLVRCKLGYESQIEYLINNIIPYCISKGIPYKEIAVLVKSKKQIQEINSKLKKENIPCYVAIRKLKKTEIIDWLQDCARWCIDNEKIRFDEIVNKWIKFNGINIRLISDIQLILHKNKIFKILKESKNNSSLDQWISYLDLKLKFKEIFYQNEMFPNEWDSYLELVTELKEGEFISYDLYKFANLYNHKDEVYLTTRHSSKGLEFEVIVILEMEDGRFPFYKNLNNNIKLEEEKRLFFVCLSRAKRICYLLMSNNYIVNGKFGPYKKKQEPSRFWGYLNIDNVRRIDYS